jgi:rod shape-determining protein MreC
LSNHTHNSEGTQFIVIFTFSIALMVTDHYTQLMTQFRSLLMTALTPVEQAAKAPVQIYQYLSQDFATLNQVKAQNTQLRTELLLLKA